MFENVEYVKKDDELLATVVRSGFDKEGLSFFSEEGFGIQMGMHLREKDTFIEPHAHNSYEELKDLKVIESFLVMKGKVLVEVFDNSDNKIKDITLEKDDCILLNCPHSLKLLEDSKILEFKQGPYRGKEKDKRFLK